MVHQVKKSETLAFKNQMPEKLKNIGEEMVQGCTQMFAESVQLSKEMMACRSGKDIIALQSKAAQQLLDSYFSQTNKLFSLVFESYADSLDALNKRSNEMQKAAA